MQCAFEETSFSLESWTDSAFLIFSVVGIEVGLIVTFLNQVCKNSCDSVLFADFVSLTTTASLCRRCWSFQSEMWKCSVQADRCLFSKQLRLFREFGSSWLCVYYPWSFSFRWSDPNLKRDWLVFVGTSPDDRNPSFFWKLVREGGSVGWNETTESVARFQDSHDRDHRIWTGRAQGGVFISFCITYRVIDGILPFGGAGLCNYVSDTCLWYIWASCLSYAS